LLPDSACPSFSIKDPQNKQTNVLKTGDPLDMDLIVHNPSGKPIVRFRTWIAFDPTAIMGEQIDVSNLFPTPTPGEQVFSVSDGYIKISGTADVTQNDTKIIVARIRLHTLPKNITSTPVTFYDVSGSTTSRTGVFTKESGQEANIATETQGSLLILLAHDAPPGEVPPSVVDVSAGQNASLPTPASSAASSVASVSTSGSKITGLAPPAPTPTAFNLLQVKHLRVTTEGSSVFLSWDVLPSSEIVGYNLYYGTVSGKYIQKRSVDKNSTNITIRALSVGTTYYFAVRGVNAKNRETDFSQEVGVSVGNPATSTAPLTASAMKQIIKTPKTDGKVSGETGVSSTLLLFLLLSAIIGTTLAFRRQLHASTTP
jgi:hypothetical protein